MIKVTFGSGHSSSAHRVLISLRFLLLLPIAVVNTLFIRVAVVYICRWLQIKKKKKRVSYVKFHGHLRLIIGLFVSIIQLTLCTGSHPVIVNVLTWFSYISSFVAY